MRKLFITLSFLSLIYPTFAQDKQAPKSNNTTQESKSYKKEFVDACLEEMGDFDEKIAKEYCSCSADKILAKFTIEEIEALMLAMEDSQSAVDVFEKTIETCIIQLENQLSE